MVKIRLMRIGARKQPFYRVVAVDERNKRNGAYLELLGTYNPLTEPKEIKLKQDRIDEWVKKGAQLSDGFLRIIGKAPQKPPRKPKKEKKETPKAEGPTVISSDLNEKSQDLESTDSTSQAPLNDDEKEPEETKEAEAKEEVES